MSRIDATMVESAASASQLANEPIREEKIDARITDDFEANATIIFFNFLQRAEGNETQNTRAGT